MTHTDKALLRSIRERGRCEFCGRACACDPHHITKRGMGGGGRLDISINLIGLCRGFDHRGVYVSCHEDAERGVLARCDLLAVVAAREKTRQDCIDSVIRFLMRLDKHASVDRMMDGVRKMRPGAGELALRVLREMGKLPKEEAA